jgi:hypothetical protein
MVGKLGGDQSCPTLIRYRVKGGRARLPTRNDERPRRHGGGYACRDFCATMVLSRGVRLRASADSA